MEKLLGYDIQISYDIHQKYSSISQEDYLENFIEVLGKLPIGELSPQLDQFIISSLINRVEKSRGNEVHISESPFLRLSTPPINTVLFFIDHVHFLGSNTSKKRINIDQHITKINDLVSNIISLIVANEIISNNLEVSFELTFDFDSVKINKIKQFVNIEFIDENIEDYSLKFKYKYNEFVSLVMETKRIKPDQNDIKLLVDIIYEQTINSISDLNLKNLKNDLIAVKDEIGGRLN